MFTPPAFLSHRKAAVLRDVTREAKSLISRADDVIHQAGNRELQPEDQREKEVEDWLSKVQEIKEELRRIEKAVEDGISSSTNTIQDQIDQLREDIGKLMEMGDLPNGVAVDHDACTFVPLADSKLMGIRFVENLRQILSWLDSGVCRIGVYGKGGVGKTTLATHIHDELLKKLKSSAGNVYWVTVSNEATVFDLQSKIGEAIHCRDSLTVKNLKKRAGILRLELSEKKSSVLILDDVWRDIMLEEVGIPDGFQLLITTRSREVCLRMECKQIVNVGCLSEEESWEFFREVLGGIYRVLSDDVKDIARLICEKCAGLPLGIKVVAASMRGVDAIHEWRNALAELNKSTRQHQGLEMEVFPSLKLSFDRLNDMLVQKCFLYCALYPEDYEFFVRRIEKRSLDHEDEQAILVEAWISEGLLEGLESRQDQIDKAYVVLNKLLNACLLEPVALNGIRVKMHDLVRDMAVNTGRDCHRYMTKAGQHIEDTVLRKLKCSKDLTKVSMVGCGIKVLSLASPPNCPNLTTLLLRENPIVHISRDFFLYMKGLKVLDLSYTKIEKLPDSISNVENLIALLLRSCVELQYVPSFRKLRKLKELDLDGCWKLLNMPRFKDVKPLGMMLRKLAFCGGSNLCCLLEGMECLTSLKLLDWGCVFVPLSGKLPALCQLEELRLDPRFKNIKAADLMQLVCLKRLGKCGFDVEDFCRYVSSRHYLQLDHYEFHVTQANVITVGHGVLYLSVSKSVFLFGLRSEELTTLPSDAQGVVFRHCDFGITRSVDSIPCLLLGVAGEIREMRIIYCSGIEFVWSSASSSSPFPKLESLELFKLDDFKGLVKGGVLSPPPCSLQHLRMLFLHHCGEMLKKLFTPIMTKRHFQNLEKLSIKDCKGLREVIGASEEEDGSTHENADIETGDGFITQQEHHLHQYFLNLKELHLDNLPELKRICSHHVGVLSSASIEFIHVRTCPKLKNLPLYLPSNSDNLLCAPSRLEKIEADRRWWASLEWNSHEAKIILEEFLSDKPFEE